MEEELWVPIRGFPNYSVSNLGGVFNNKTGENMRVSRTNHGHLKISLISAEGVRHTKSVALLVAQEFVDAPDLTCDQVIILNGDLSDVSAPNLAWRPSWFSWHYTRQLKQAIPAYYKVLPVLNVDLSIEYESIVEAGTTEGLLFNDIWKSTYSRYRPYPSNSIFEVIDRV